MAKYSSRNEKAPLRGFLTLAHTGDPTPVTWIGGNFAGTLTASTGFFGAALFTSLLHHLLTGQVRVPLDSGGQRSATPL